MAQRRFISRRLTESDKIGKLRGDDRARFIYVALLPYTDKGGRLNANPVLLKTSCLEAFEYSAEQVADALDALASVGLIRLYRTPQHELVAQYEKFMDFNTPHPKESESDLPESGDPATARGAWRCAVKAITGNDPESSRKVPGNDPESSGGSKSESEIRQTDQLRAREAANGPAAGAAAEAAPAYTQQDIGYIQSHYGKGDTITMAPLGNQVTLTGLKSLDRQKMIRAMHPPKPVSPIELEMRRVREAIRRKAAEA